MIYVPHRKLILLLWRMYNVLRTCTRTRTCVHVVLGVRRCFRVARTKGRPIRVRVGPNGGYLYHLLCLGLGLRSSGSSLCSSVQRFATDEDEVHAWRLITKRPVPLSVMCARTSRADCSIIVHVHEARISSVLFLVLVRVEFIARLPK